MFKDIYFVLKYVQAFIAEHDLLRRYQELSQNVTQVQAAAGADAETLEETIEQDKEELFEAHSNLNLLVWTPPQKAILKHIGGYRILGKRAIDFINDSFNRGTGSQKGIVEDLNQLRTDTNELNSRVTQTLTNLDLDEYEDVIPENKASIEIAFKGISAFKNFWETNDRAKDWTFVFRAFTELTGEKFEDIETVSWSSASPDIGVWVEMGVKTADAIIKAAQAVAGLKKIKDMIFKKKKIAKEEVGLTGDALKVAFKDIEVKHGKEYELKIAEVTLELRKGFGQNSTRPQGDGDNQIGLALGKMVELLRDGSRIIDPDEVRPVMKDEDGAILSKAYKENRELEKGIQTYLKAEELKRLEARTHTMRRELQLPNNEPSTSWKKEQIQNHLKELGLDTTGTKKVLINRFQEYKKSQKEEMPEDAAKEIENQESETPEK